MTEHYVIAHVNTLDLFKDKTLFNSKKKAKEYLKGHLTVNLHSFWFICSINEYNKLCEEMGVRYKQIKE